MPETRWLQKTSPAFRLMIATSWLAPDSWQKIQGEAIREAVEAGPDWDEFIRLVYRHRTPALSWTSLSRMPRICVPEPAREELQKCNHDCRVQAIRHCRQLVSVLKAFNRAGIPVLPLKGPVQSSNFYGDVGLRQSKDLDLVVSQEDGAKAQACLIDLGWQLDSAFFPMTPRQWEKFLQMEDDLIFINSTGTVNLELHSRVLGDSPELNSARWFRTIPSVWQGCSYQALDPFDRILYLCSHGGAHAWFRAKWLGDLARIRTQERLDWDEVLCNARNTGQDRPLLACLQLLQILYGIPLPKLQGNPWRDLPAFLIDGPLRALQTAKEPPQRGAIESLPDLYYSIRYPRLILPRKPWSETLSELLYCRQDYWRVPLPDSLFWAYAPLRPFLFAWRKITQIRNP